MRAAPGLGLLPLLLPAAAVGLTATAAGRPCDIFASHGTPCAAAHAVTRSLYSAYAGPLYQLKRYGDNTTLDVHALAPGGVADAAAHDKFCSEQHPPPPPPTPWPHGVPPGDYPPRADCVMLKIYDQSGNGNHLLVSTPAVNNPAFNNPVNATRHPISVGGHKAYGAYFETGMGYRAQNTSKVAVDNEPETIYMVTSGTHVNALCCFDYGNSENDCTDPSKYCDGCMEAVYMGTGYGGKGKPWIGVDMENGIYGGPSSNDTFLHAEFVTAMGKGGTSSFATKGADATAGNLTTLHDGPRPKGYQPMHKTGAIILGVGGDNLASRQRGELAGAGAGAVGTRVGLGAGGEVSVPGLSIGTFYEGVMTAGYSTDAADALVQADIVAAGYGK